MTDEMTGLEAPMAIITPAAAVTTVDAIANYFIWRANANAEFGDNMTNLKLQKLLYYAQGFNLAWYGVPIFPDPIEAWAHGPVVRSIYEKYQGFANMQIPTPFGYDPRYAILTMQTRDLLEEVYGVYGQYSASGLRNLTREEPPWKDTPLNEIISLEAMRAYFVDHLTAE